MLNYYCDECGRLIGTGFPSLVSIRVKGKDFCCQQCHDKYMKTWDFKEKKR